MSLSLGTQLRLLVDALDGAVDGAYGATDLDFRARYYPYFRLLIDEGELSVGQFAARLGYTQPAVTQTMALMRDADLVELSASPDRRQRRYRLTQKARAMTGDLQRVWAAVGAAATRIDRSLPAPLGDILSQSLDLLSRTPFSQMIEEELCRADIGAGRNRDDPDDSGKVAAHPRG